MDTTVYHPIPILTTYTSPTPNNHRLRANPKNVPTHCHVALAVMRDLNLTRISSKYISELSKSVFPVTVNSRGQMATKNHQPQDTKKEEEAQAEKLPPPEKPEPGDCCGSGCIRCVWDVYYEELEAYNKLCKTNSNDSVSNSKPSS